jgi:phage/plasmid-like protein (TIGR03299 family)
MHLIDMSNNRANMAYKGEVPWHGLGVEMPENADMQLWKIEAGLNWEAKKVPVHFMTEPKDDAKPRVCKMLDRHVLYRDDTNAALGVVGGRYRIVQPGQIMDFYAELCEHNGFAMETAGALRDGKIVWALAKTGQGINLLGEDQINEYLLLSTSFDGSMATTARYTSVRVVCNNTLQVARGDRQGLVVVPHSAEFKFKDMKVKLGIGEGWDAFTSAATAMAFKKVTPTQSVEFFLNVYHNFIKGEASPTEKQEKAMERTVKRLTEQYLFAPGAELGTARDTVWGLLNAVTHDIDFQRKAHSQDTRLTSAWYGDGASIKAKAFDLAVALAK